MSIADRVVNADHPHDSFVYVMAIIASLNGLLFGYDTGVISGALLSITETFGLSTFLQQVVTASVLIGAMIGAMVGGRLADRIGRRRLTLVASVVFIVSSLALAVAPGVYWLVGWRIVLGIAVGLASIIGPLYISEIAPPDIRGSLGFLQQLMITIGILIAYIANYLFAPSFFDITGWRWMLGFGAVPAVALGIGIYFLPESPRWLVDHGRPEEAREVLSRIREHGSVDDEVDEIREISETEEKGDLSDLLAPWIRPALMVGIGLAIFQQIVGINAIIYYAPTILTSIGFSDSAALFGTVGIGIINVVMTVVAVVLADRVGRRPLLLVGTVGMAVMLGIIGFGFLLPGLSGIVGYVTLGGMLIYIAFYAISLGPVFWLLISEIYPLRVRGTATGVATFFEWGANFLVSFTFLSLIERLGQAVSFWILGIISVIAFAFCYYRVPETMGRSLEEIEKDLRESTIIGSDTTSIESDSDKMD